VKPPSSTVGCLGKIGYPTRAEADRSKGRILGKAEYLRNGDGRTAVGLEVYHCRKCGRFHLGRNKRKGAPPTRRVPDHERGSLKNRFARWLELTREGGE
jgi:hypothetical protein